MSNKKMILHFTLLTFIIAYSTSGLLIILGQYGYKVYNWVNTLQQFIMNIPFAIYILSPAIASFAILKIQQDNRYQRMVKNCFLCKK
ncbi:MAG: hypothetical protein ACLSBH_11390 [Coprobacillus cateniformis]